MSSRKIRTEATEQFTIVTRSRSRARKLNDVNDAVGSTLSPSPSLKKKSPTNFNTKKSVKTSTKTLLKNASEIKRRSLLPKKKSTLLNVIISDNNLNLQLSTSDNNLNLQLSTSDNNLKASTVMKDIVTCNVNAAIPEAEAENKENTTYELIEPETSTLQQMIKKYTGTEANADKEDVKRLYNNSRQMDIQRSDENSLMSSSKSKSNTVINIITSENKKVRRSQSLNNMISNLSSDKIQTTPQTFASAKTQSEEKLSIRKTPNFRIHEKLLAKSESFKVPKKSLEDRHQAFAASKIPTIDRKKEVKLLSTDTNNGIYNRFGFKLRKAEATHVILKKQTVFSRQKQQQETQMVKGVRTNRRFELQMKSRNINV